MEQRQQLLLQFRFKIDQQVAAANQIEFGERRVRHQILRGENHHVANFLRYPVAAFFLHKEAAQSLFRDILGDVGGVGADARLLDRVFIQIGGEDLQRMVRGGVHPLLRLANRYRQRIGFFAGRAGRDPGAQRAARRVSRQQRRDHLGLELLPDLGVAEEAGHADQQLVKQQRRFLRVLAQVTDIIGDLRQLVQAHAPFDAAVQGVFFVERKIMPGLAAQHQHHFLQAALVVVGQIQRRPGNQQRDVLDVGRDPVGQFVGRRHHVGEAGVDRAPWHGVELGRGRVLHKHGAGLFLDRAQAERAVRAHAGEDHADALVLPVIGQGAEKGVNRPTQSARRGRL